jgi:hypothetical protein
MEHKEYNGWYNHETWLVSLWLSNEQDSYDMVRDMISDPYSDYAVYDLADALKEYIEEDNPLGGQANMFSDLINAAISEVNFDEIAEHWIEEYRLDNPGPTKIDPNVVYEYNMFVNKGKWLTVEPDNLIESFIVIGDSFWDQFNKIVSEANEIGLKHIIIGWDENTL